MKLQYTLKNTTTQVTEQAVQTILHDIQQGTYPVDSTLPAQRELAGQMGISRASLREALTRLEALGIVEIQAGKGVFVRALEAKTADSWRMNHQISLKDFYQLRYVLESFSAFLACEYIEAQDIAYLTENQAQLSSAINQQDWSKAAKYDHEFHQYIFQLSQNQTIIETLKHHTQSIQHSQILPFIQPKLAHKTIAEHQAILDALTAKDAKQAEHAMRNHLVCAAQRAGIFFISHT